MGQNDGAAKPARRGSGEVWLAGAYALLVEAGVGAVKVMPLARRLGLSRTSFYWHFSDREALLAAILRRWEKRNTGNLVARAGAYGESICEAMFNLFDCWLDPDLFDSRLDLAIRNWGRTDPAVQDRVDAADARRIAAVTGMFRRYGYGERDAEVRARTTLYTQTGYIAMQVSEDPVPRLARMPDYLRVFTGREPAPHEVDRFMARHAGLVHAKREGTG